MKTIGRYYVALDPMDSTQLSFRCSALPQGVIAVARQLAGGEEVARASKAAGADVIELSIPARPAPPLERLEEAQSRLGLNLGVSRRGGPLAVAVSYEITLLAPGESPPALGGPTIYTEQLEANPGPNAWFFNPFEGEQQARTAAQHPWPPPPPPLRRGVVIRG